MMGPSFVYLHPCLLATIRPYPRCTGAPLALSGNILLDQFFRPLEHHSLGIYLVHTTLNLVIKLFNYFLDLSGGLLLIIKENPQS